MSKNPEYLFLYKMVSRKKNIFYTETILQVFLIYDYREF
jgi:hypothetical protein